MFWLINNHMECIYDFAHAQGWHGVNQMGNSRYLDINIFPISVILVSIFCGILSYHVISNSLPYLSLRNIFLINIKWLFIFYYMMIIKSLLVRYNNLPTDLDDLGHLMFMWPLYFCMKPLCGVSEHIQSFGILIILALIYWNKNCYFFQKSSWFR